MGHDTRRGFEGILTRAPGESGSRSLLKQWMNIYDHFNRGVLRRPVESALRPGVAVVDQVRGHDRMGLVVGLPDRHPQRRQHQLGGSASRGVPDQDSLRVDIHDERDIDQAGDQVRTYVKSITQTRFGA